MADAVRAERRQATRWFPTNYMPALRDPPQHLDIKVRTQRLWVKLR
ncbi:MAG TPA: hypothetical protein VGM50_21810 [Gemmatimonadaceae bacterium]